MKRFSEEAVYPSVVLSCLFCRPCGLISFICQPPIFFSPLPTSRSQLLFRSLTTLFLDSQSLPTLFFHDFCLFYFYGFFLGFCSKTKLFLRYLRYLSLSLSLYLSWSLVFSLFSLSLPLLLPLPLSLPLSLSLSR